ncbi:MAG: hypothetical protein IT555_11815 [Acetobacteraceae bacterium]|nr:hypothetical protein [Acetobacteraceae bacterium]
MTTLVAGLRERRVLSVRGSRVDAVALGILAVVLLFVVTTVIRSPLKDDVAWLLWVARKWLDGQNLYVDLVEVNPPLVIWLYAIPARIASGFGLAPKLASTLFFAGILLGSAWWTATLLQGRAPLLERRVPVFSLIATLLLVLPGVEFGQREHLLAASVLPYIALFVRALEGEREPWVQAGLAGSAAALGCAMKPSYGLALVLVEVVGLLRGHRRVRLAPIAFVATTGLYGIAVLVFEPDFLTKAVPLALALYGGTDTSVWRILAESRNLLLGQAIALLLCWHSQATLGRHSSFLRHLYLALVAFAVACTVLFVMQGKDWFYHRLPATTATVLALILWLSVVLMAQAGRLGTGVPALPWRRVSGPVALTVAALIAFGAANVQRVRPWVVAAAEPNLSTEVKLVKLIKREKAKTYIAFSEWIALGFPVVNDSGVSWASRFDSMWALKGEIWRTREDGRAPRDWPIRRWVARDFVAGCPDIAVVDTREGINYIGVLVSSDQEFARAWSHYREIAAFDGLRVFKRDEAGCASEPLPPGRSPQSAVTPSE